MWEAGDGATSESESSSKPIWMSASFPWIFKCFLREEGWVYVLSQPRTPHVNGFSVVCTCMCFFRSLELANRRSQPWISHSNGFSPGTNDIKFAS